MTSIATRLAALAATALLAGCGIGRPDTLFVPPSEPIPSASLSPTVANREALAKLAGRPNLPFTGNPDQDFAVNMVPHHQAAIELAEMELKYGRDPTMRRVAQQIIRNDAFSKTELNAWLQSHPVPQQPERMIATP